MTDIVNLAVKMPTDSLLKGAKALDNVDKAGAKAQKSLDGVSSNSGKASTGIAKVASSAGNATGSISTLSSKLGGLSTIIGGIGLASLATDAFSTFRSFESMNASLKTVTGSAEAAAEAFALIKDFAETTPYTLDQSVEGFQKLKALGLDPSISSLRSYGNTAAAMGKDMMQMIPVGRKW